MGFLKKNKSKIGGFPPIRGRMESMIIKCIFFFQTHTQNENFAVRKCKPYIQENISA